MIRQINVSGNFVLFMLIYTLIDVFFLFVTKKNVFALIVHDRCTDFSKLRKTQ